MQDYNYLHSNCFEITVEQGCGKFPRSSKLEDIWEENRLSLIKFIEEVHKGVKGFVRVSDGTPISGAVIAVRGRDHPIRSVTDGDYWRLLVPGEYVLEVSANGYRPITATVTVPKQGAVNQNFTLVKVEEESTTQMITTQAPPTTTHTDSTTPLTDEEVSTTEVESADKQDIEIVRIHNITGGSFSVDLIHIDKPEHKPTQAVMVASIWLLVIIGVLILAVVGLATTIACQMRKSRAVRKGFAPVPLEEVPIKSRLSSERGYFTNGHDLSSDEDVVGDFSNQPTRYSYSHMH